MGMVSLNRLMFKHKGRRRSRRVQARTQRKDSLYQDHPHGGERLNYSGPNLPEDVWGHIHSLMPLRDSARSACVSCAFRHSWRCYPKLTFTEKALGLKQKEGQQTDIAMDFTSIVDRILENHSAAGVKTLELRIPRYCNVNTFHLNNWLQNAITPGIEEVTLLLPSNHREEYNFPCSILINECGNSIRYLNLTNCAFRPTVGFDSLRSLTKLDLHQVLITGAELECLISNSFALEQLILGSCIELVCLKIPFCLKQLRYLCVGWCKNLQVIESTAPNLCTFDLLGDPVQMSPGKSSQVKNLHVGFSHKPDIVSYAITKLPSIVPNLETLTISSMYERINAPMVADKFRHLKYLKIFLCISRRSFPPTYDYLSLVSFLDASPLLETFILSIKHPGDMNHDSISGHMRQIPEHKHYGLKEAKINGFFSAKSMVELTCYILENAKSLESLTVDTIYNSKEDGNIGRCHTEKNGECWTMDRDLILQAHKALGIINRYIVGRIPSSVKLNVGEPCSRCRARYVKAPQLSNN